MEIIGRFDKLIGNPNEKEIEEFSLQEIEKTKNIAREKTLEEIDLIGYSDLITNELREKYGLKKRVISNENVFIIKESKWSGEGADGTSDTMSGVIQIKDKDYIIPNFMMTLHEMLHEKSFKAAQVLMDEKGSEETITGYRSGLFLRSRNGENEFFDYLNEGITELLVKELFDKAIRENEILKSEYGKMKADFPERLNKARTHRGELLDHFVTSDPIDEGTFFISEDGYSWANFPYQKNIEALHRLVKELFSRNKEKFGSEDEILEIFKRGYFVGNFLEIGRLIDGSFGRGTFKKIGRIEKDSDVNKFFESLS